MILLSRLSGSHGADRELLSGYVPEVVALQEQIEPLIPDRRPPCPRWISTPSGDQGSEWCADCGYYMVRNLRRHDRKRRSDYILDGGWRTEEDHFCFCAGCGVQLDVSLTGYGVDTTIDTFEEWGVTTSPPHDAYEINELLNYVAYRNDDDQEQEERRTAVIAIAERFVVSLAQEQHPASGVTVPADEAQR